LKLCGLRPPKAARMLCPLDRVFENDERLVPDVP
jgi:hypothetical protein